MNMHTGGDGPVMFIDGVLGGLVGPVQAYFGTVEEQGRKTLHLHLLGWLYGVPNPKQLADKVAHDRQWRQRLFAYLDTVVTQGFSDFSCLERPATTRPLPNEQLPVERHPDPADRNVPPSQPIPCSCGEPHQIHLSSLLPPDPDAEDFKQQVLNTDTCLKFL